MSKFDSAVNFTYNVIVSPIKLGYWAWKKVRPSKNVVVHNDSCPRFSEIPVISDTSKIDAAWPPAPHPVEAQSVHDLFAANGKLIRELCYASTLSEEESQRFLLPVITNLASIVHLTPASEYDHHQGYGGLFTHSLEVAYYAANEAKTTIFDRSASPRLLHQNKRRWILTAVLAALSHDVGKVFTDMTITAPDGRHWAADEPILTWLRRNNIESYFISFRPGRKHNAHKSASLAKSTMLIPPITFKFLGLTGYGEIMETEYRNALLQGKEGGLIGRILDNADGTSRRADQLRQRQIRPEFKNVSHPQADQLLKAMRVLIQHAIWTTNKDGKSRVFNTKQGCFIVWSEDVVSEARNQAFDMGYVSLPSDLLKMATVLADAGVAVRNTDEVSNTHNVFWRVTPIVLGTIQLDCIKLADPNFIFDAVPPATIESIVEGVAIDEETRNAWVKQWKFMPVQRISRNEELEMGYTEDFIEALTKDAEDHIREAEALEQNIYDYGSTSSGEWASSVNEQPSFESSSASKMEVDTESEPSQSDSEADFAGAMADFGDDEEKFNDTDALQHQTVGVSAPMQQAIPSVSDTESQKPVVAMKRKPTITTAVVEESSEQVPVELDMSIVLPEGATTSSEVTKEQAQIRTQKKKDKTGTSTEFNMSALLGEDPDLEDEAQDVDEEQVTLSAQSDSDFEAQAKRDTSCGLNHPKQSNQSAQISPIITTSSELKTEESEEQDPGQDIRYEAPIDAMDWGTYADLDGSAPFDDDMAEPATDKLLTSNQKEVGQQTVRVRSVHNTESKDQKTQTAIPIGFINEPSDQAGYINKFPTAKPRGTSGNAAPGHLGSGDEVMESAESTVKAKSGRGRPTKRLDADRLYNDAENFVKDMTTQMEHGVGLFIMGNLTLDYTSGLLSTRSQAFEQAMRELGIDDLLVEMILEKQAQSDDRPRIEWNRKDGKVLFVR